MPRPTPLYEWTAHVATRFPDLPAAHARSLAEWSYGMAVAHAVRRIAVALQLAALLGRKVNTVRQRLRELFRPGDRKAGDRRTTFDPHACCGPRVRRITGGWTDAGNPVAWRILPGNTPGESRNAIRIELVGRVRAALGDDWRVFVPTDRGPESAAPFRALVTAGCHPLMRAKAGGQFRPAGWARWRRGTGTGSRRGGRRTRRRRSRRTAPRWRAGSRAAPTRAGMRSGAGSSRDFDWSSGAAGRGRGRG